jgi:hypothetical protein
VILLYLSKEWHFGSNIQVYVTNDGIQLLNVLSVANARLMIIDQPDSLLNSLFAIKIINSSYDLSCPHIILELSYEIHYNTRSLFTSTHFIN